MSWTITLIALLQTLMVIVGFFALGAVLKGCGYPDDPTVRWNPLAVMLRERGFLLLGVPVLWTFYAVDAQRRDEGWLSRQVALATGGALAFALIAGFVYALCRPYTRPILFWLGN